MNHCLRKPREIFYHDPQSAGWSTYDYENSKTSREYHRSMSIGSEGMANLSKDSSLLPGIFFLAFRRLWCGWVLITDHHHQEAQTIPGIPKHHPAAMQKDEKSCFSRSWNPTTSLALGQRPTYHTHVLRQGYVKKPHGKYHHDPVHSDPLQVSQCSTCWMMNYYTPPDIILGHTINKQDYLHLTFKKRRGLWCVLFVNLVVLQLGMWL